MTRNVIFQRTHFNRRVQLEGETAEQFIIELYNLSEFCDYGELTSEMICNRLVIGIRDRHLSKRLQLDSELTLEKAKKAIHQNEAVQGQQNMLKGATVELSHSLDRLQAGYGARKESENFQGRSSQHDTGKETHQRDHNSSKSCSRCGKAPHVRDRCPAKDAVCYSCQKKGHFSSVSNQISF